MSEELKVKLTCEEGSVLLGLAAGFALPEQMGDQKFSVPDRAVAADDVDALFQTLKAYSQSTRGARRMIIFGPPENLTEEKVGEDGVKRREHIDTDLEVEVRLSEEAISGAMWCLFGSVCPAAGERSALAIQTQREILWPIAAKLGKTKAIRELVGYNKGTPRRWKSDEDYAKEEKKAGGDKKPAEGEKK